MRTLARGCFALGLLVSGAAQAAPSCENCDEKTISADDIPKDAPKFSDFPATIVKIRRPAAPNVNVDPNIRRYRAMIRFGAARGPNFAGHYTLVEYGCGASCSAFVVVDALSGHVFQLPEMATVIGDNIDPALRDKATGWVQFRTNSRLIRAIGDINEDPSRRGVSYFVWNGRRLQGIRFAPRPQQPLKPDVVGR